LLKKKKKKAKPNTLARYLWNVPGWQEFYREVMKKREEEEEKTVMSLNGEERQKYYENRIRTRERLGLELNDYLPLLAFRWDRKLALATYLKNSDNADDIERLSSIPGGVKQIFMNAGIIGQELDRIDITKPEFRY